MADRESASNPRAESFGYACQRCMRCCRHKMIQVDPHEIARLARRFGQTTTEFRTTWTENGAGNHLRRKDDGACVFLGPEGCTVYTDRPLVCRIYPLGRHVDPDGVERFSHVTPHPETEGVYSRDGTIAEFLEKQGAEPFMQIADRYAQWLRSAVSALGMSIYDIDADPDNVGDESAFELIDMDTAVAAHCTAANIAEPIELEERVELHLKILNEGLKTLKGGNNEGPQNAAH